MGNAYFYTDAPVFGPTLLRTISWIPVGVNAEHKPDLLRLIPVARTGFDYIPSSWSDLCQNWDQNCTNFAELGQVDVTH